MSGAAGGIKRAASKDAGRTRDLALLAVLLARNLRVTVDWRRFLIGYAVAHLANAYRVEGDLDEADSTLDVAKRFCAAGRDSHQLLDPGRLLSQHTPTEPSLAHVRQLLSSTLSA
jgi:hypothetical protein